MKLEQHQVLEIKTEISVKKNQEVEYILIGHLKPRKGQFIWEINEITGDIKKADYERDTVAVLGAKIPPKKLIIRPDCVYIPALNAKNAKLKYDEDKSQSSYYVKNPPFSLEDSQNLNNSRNKI